MVRSGGGFDGGQGHDFAEFLRRELHAAADQVEPGADGLERIRDKIRSRPAHARQPRGMLGVWLACWGAVMGLVHRLGSLGDLARRLADLVRRMFPAGGGDRYGPVPRQGARTGRRAAGQRAAGAAAAQGLARGDAAAGLCHRRGRVHLSALSCRSYLPHARRW